MEAKELLTRIGRVQFHLGDDPELYIEALRAMCKVFFPVSIARSLEDEKMWEYVGYCGSFEVLPDGKRPPIYDMVFKRDELTRKVEVIKIVKR